MIEVLNARLIDSLDEVDARAWNALSDSAYPFLRHEFLSALEHNDCLGRRSGWKPAYMIFESPQGELLAGLPMYLKFNSFGEFVFDWAWAEAYQYHGLAYYPKLVIASPFTPATGPRLLVGKSHRSSHVSSVIVASAIQSAGDLGVSGLHILFSNQTCDIEHPALLRRFGCQFHWENRGYATFDDFLEQLNSKRRKEIKRERRRVVGSGIEIERIPGNLVSIEQWREFYIHYESTFEQHGNFAALTPQFFHEIATTMGEQILLVIASRRRRMLASAFFLVGSTALYGRYWGCSEDVPGLHFEACYYQGIEYCIEHKLASFEPGAQGEHKISRGFLPVRTWSAHWIKDPRFRSAIADFLRQEEVRMNEYMDELNLHSPYRNKQQSLV